MRLTYRESFLKDMNALPAGRLKNELIDAIADLKEASGIAELLLYFPVKKLRGYNNHYRFRIENHRLGFRLESDGSLTLLHFLERGEIYKKFPS